MPDGSIDNDFHPGANAPIVALAQQPDGRLVIAGTFTVTGGFAREGIARLSADGIVDPDYRPDLDGVVRTLAMQADGKVLVGGDGGAFLARLNLDGSIDATWTTPTAASTSPRYVNNLAIAPDGKVYASGQFLDLGGNANNDYFGRLNAPQAALQGIDVIAYVNGPALIRWRRGGTSPELVAPPDIAVSTNGNTYTVLGAMRRGGGGWMYDAYTPTLAQTFYVRVRGRVSNAGDSANAGVEQRVRQVHVVRADGIFADGFE